MLKDSDRIFTNLYGLEDPFLKGAKKRGDLDKTKKIQNNFLLGGVRKFFVACEEIFRGGFSEVSVKNRFLDDDSKGGARHGGYVIHRGGEMCGI